MSLSSFTDLQSATQDAMGRTDIPTYVYTLAGADIERDLRVRAMLKTTTLTASAELVALPTDFIDASNVYLDTTPRCELISIPDESTAIRHDSSGEPRYFGVTESDNVKQMRLMPVPSGTYTISLTYYALSAITAGNETNAVLKKHPGTYLYASLHHAAVWAKDPASAQSYGQEYLTEVSRANKTDLKSSMPARMITRKR